MSWHVLLHVSYVIVSPLPGAQFAGSEEAGASEDAGAEFLATVGDCCDGSGGIRANAWSRAAANSVQSRLDIGSDGGSGRRSKFRNSLPCWMRKSRCGPVARPVMPTRPIRWPCWTRSPECTNTRDKCM